MLSSTGLWFRGLGVLGFRGLGVLGFRGLGFRVYKILAHEFRLLLSYCSTSDGLKHMCLQNRKGPKPLKPQTFIPSTLNPAEASFWFKLGLNECISRL